MTNPGTGIRYNGQYTDQNIPIRYKDTIIDKYTKYVFDSLDTQSWPSQSAPLSGNTWKSLTNQTATASFLSPDYPGFAGGGFNFAEYTVSSPSSIATKTEQIILPATAKIAASSKGHAFAFWVNRTGGTSGKQTRIGGWFYGFTGPFGLYQQDNTFTIICDGKHSDRSSISTNTRHQFAAARVDDGSGGYQIRFYVDGVMVDSKAGNSTVSQPSTAPANATLGHSPDSGLSSSLAATFQGRQYRHWMTDAETIANVFTAAYADQLIATDWTDNKDRSFV